MIRSVFQDATILLCPDYDSWYAWWNNTCAIIGQGILQDAVFYVNRKEQDLCNFKFSDKEYVDSTYIDIIQDSGYAIKTVTYPRLLGINVNATDIRVDINAHKHYIDGRVYRILQNLTKGEKQCIIKDSGW